MTAHDPADRADTAEFADRDILSGYPQAHRCAALVPPLMHAASHPTRAREAVTTGPSGGAIARDDGSAAVAAAS